MLARNELVRAVVKALGLASTAAGNMVSRPWSTASHQDDALDSYTTSVHSAREVTGIGRLPALLSSEPMGPSYGGLSFPSTVPAVILQGSHPNKIPRRMAQPSLVKLILYQSTQLHSSSWSNG